ncbi:NUDIX hydrolase [Kineosporia sp. J2-2]|uniref:NUDIX hydrolase n=1 Tax=Kineosporia corallincola TaxID=2835133 RepID=A0ABS5TTU5_9ACTN|nr:NUDIX hydrolase [Kineosporia corallincola]MBT0774229.1 NUDIX hydrolase [Kineosporia corallincola]
MGTSDPLFVPYLLPVSVKGIAFEDGKVWLRMNERQEWELPGGKMDAGEQPRQTAEREIREELGLASHATNIVGADVYVIPNSVDESNGVLVLSYVCEVSERIGPFELWGEAGAAKFQRFAINEIQDLPMPDFYKQAIRAAVALNQSSGSTNP